MALAGDQELKACPECGDRYNAARLKACPRCASRNKSQGTTSADNINRQRQETASMREAFVRDAMDRIAKALAAGRTPYLHLIEFIGSNFSIDGTMAGNQPVAARLAGYGWDGWEVVAAFPRTASVTLPNIGSGNWMYGGGVGGLVDGAFVLMRLAVTADQVAQEPEQLERMLAEMFDRDLRNGQTTPARIELTPGTAPTVKSPPKQSGSGGFVGIGMGVDF